MLIYFIHGVATREADYANSLITLIKEEYKRENRVHLTFVNSYERIRVSVFYLQCFCKTEMHPENQPIPHFHAGFWGNILMGTDKLWRDIEQELQHLKQEDPKFDPNTAFCYQSFRKEYFSYFIGDVFSYLSSERGEKIRSIIANQLTDFIKNHPHETKLHIIAHSLGTVILWDVLFSDRFKPSDPAFEIRSLIGKDSSQVSLSGITTMGSPIPFLNLTLGIDAHQIKSFSEKYQRNAIIWNNLVNSHNIIAYPIRPLFESLSTSLGFSVRDHYLNNNLNFVDVAELAAVVLGSTNAHICYWKSKNVAKIITDSIVEENSLARIAIKQLKKVSGMTEDDMKMNPIKAKILFSGEFSDSSGQISLISDAVGIDHVYVSDHHNHCLYAAYVGWIHGEGLKKAVKDIRKNLCQSPQIIQEF